MRRAAKVDVNQGSIVAALRAAGATVQHLQGVGDGAPDLLVGAAGRNYLIEVKPKGKNLRTEQETWFNAWNGQAGVAHTDEDALRIIGAMK